MANIPGLTELLSMFGIVVSIIGVVYLRIRNLEKVNASLRRDGLDHELKDIEKDNAARSDTELVDRANRYWSKRK